MVFVAKPDNFDCSQESSFLPRSMRTVQIQNINITTEINFNIKNGLTYKQYIIAIIGTTIVLLVIGAVLVVLAIVFHRYGSISKVRPTGR